MGDTQQTLLRQEMLTWMQTQQSLHHYRQVVLFDTQGTPLLWAKAQGSSPDSPSVQKNPDFQAALHSKSILTTDLHRALIGSHFIHFSIWIPLGVKSGPGAAADGVLLLQIDPEQTLFPLVQSWPSPSQAAEVVSTRSTP